MEHSIFLAKLLGVILVVGPVVKTIRHKQFNSDGTLLASTSDDKTTRVWETQTGRERHVLQGQIAVENIPQWVADADTNHRHRAAIDSDHVVRVWDIATNRQLVAFHGHRYTVNSVAFHPNGRQITSAGYGPPQRRHVRPRSDS